MSSNTVVDPARAGSLAQQIVTILAGEDPETRQRALRVAMMLLGENTPITSDDQRTRRPDDSADVESIGLAAFFSREGEHKPADYAQLCAAYHYSVYGTAPFSVSELKAIALDAGVVIPDRVDMTLKSAIRKGKKLFQPAQAGSFKPTAAGCVLFSEKWNVKPGRKQKVVGSKESPNAKAK
jgi:hypothetical protein